MSHPRTISGPPRLRYQDIGASARSRMCRSGHAHVIEIRTPLDDESAGLIEAPRTAVLLVHRHREFSGLTADNFVVTNNGIRQRLESVTVARVPLSVTLVLDTSGSVAGQRMAQEPRASYRMTRYWKILSGQFRMPGMPDVAPGMVDARDKRMALDMSEARKGKDRIPEPGLIPKKKTNPRRPPPER